VTQALANTLSRPADICERYRGGEFAIILPKTKNTEIVEEKCLNAPL
jgi:FOG: GGDEF domain